MVEDGAEQSRAEYSKARAQWWRQRREQKTLEIEGRSGAFVFVLLCIEAWPRHSRSIGRKRRE